MKLTTSLISAVALHAASAVSRETASGCNVEGNLFQLEAFATIGSNDTGLNPVSITPWGELGTDSLAVLDFPDSDKIEQSVFYINKDNNNLIVLDVFNYLNAANGYTDTPEGGELKFTFFNDTSRDFYWVDFDIDEDGHLTANGAADVFTNCGGSNSTTLTGSLAIGNVPGKNCQPLDYLSIYAVSSELRIE